MKRALILLSLAGFSLALMDSCAADNTAGKREPLRDPKPGEMRDSWWLSCWAKQVVVIRGTLLADHAHPPDVRLTISPQALAKHFPHKDDQEYFQQNSGYSIAELKVDELLFAAPDISYLDSDIAEMKSGAHKATKVLVPIVQLKGTPPFLLGIDDGLRPKSKAVKGVFIFSYNPKFVMGIPMVLEEQMLEDNVEEAKAIFAYREKFDRHRKSP